MKCAACNAENPAAAKFCQACGVPLAMERAPGQVSAADSKSAGLQISPTVIGIVLLLLISVVGAGYVGWTLYEDSSSPGGTALVDEKAIEEKQPFDAARAELLRHSGTQFDPEVVRTVVAIPDEEWHAIHRQVLHDIMAREGRAA